MVLEAIRYRPGSLQILNQLKLPHQEEYDEIKSAEDGWHAIKDMRTRGAPAIAIVAALSLAVELHNNKLSDIAEEVGAFVVEKLDFLVTSRPTAVNLADAARKLKKVTETAASSDGATADAVVKAYCDAAARMLIDDVSDNQAIGKHGAEWIEKVSGGGQVSVLTHCNTGSVVLSVAESLSESDSLQISGNGRLRHSSGCDPFSTRQRLTQACFLYGDQTVQPRLQAHSLRARP